MSQQHLCLYSIGSLRCFLESFARARLDRSCAGFALLLERIILECRLDAHRSPVGSVLPASCKMQSKNARRLDGLSALPIREQAVLLDCLLLAV
ncbi:MAG: hypothetical protein ACM3NI_06975 [Bacteroidota bacterium]